jgi:hypothetical protein
LNGFFSFRNGALYIEVLGCLGLVTAMASMEGTDALEGGGGRTPSIAPSALEKLAPASEVGDDGDDSIITAEAGREVTELARKLSLRMIASSADPNPFGSSDPRLQPNSEQFDPKMWAKSLMQIAARDPELYPTRTAGVSFQNLGAHGFGSLRDHQKDVGNMWIEGLDLFRKVVGAFRPGGVRRGQRKVQILRGFDGLVKSGELLVVLGRPGRYVWGDLVNV